MLSSYPPLSEKCRKITTTIFTLSVRKAVFMGARRETVFQEALLDGCLQPIVIIFVKSLGMLFVILGCHASLSSLVVAPPCRFDRRAGNRENV
jgi:hypothetical protein